MEETDDFSRLRDRNEDFFDGLCWGCGEPWVGEDIALGERVNIAAIKRMCQKCERECRSKGRDRTCRLGVATGLLGIVLVEFVVGSRGGRASTR